jgi:hypothetical protein
VSEAAESNEVTLELALRRRLAEVVAGAASTEAELRLLAEQGKALVHRREAAAEVAEARLDTLAFEPSAGVSELASELRRVEDLRGEVKRLRPVLSALEQRARELRGGWFRQS